MLQLNKKINDLFAPFGLDQVRKEINCGILKEVQQYYNIAKN